MSLLNNLPVAIRLAILVLLHAAWLPAIVPGQEKSVTKREGIGMVFGKPVYRDEISVGENATLEEELHRLFIGPVMSKYLEEHKTEVEPTAEERKLVTDRVAARNRYEAEKEGPRKRARLEEVKTLLAKKGDLGMEPRRGIPLREALEQEKGGLEAQLEPEDSRTWQMMLDSWKVQKHLYDKFGGGRYLWQQFGMEAFDATRKMLESEEAKGHFKVTDLELRKTLLEYWTTKHHGHFLVADPRRIQDEFVHPDFLRKFEPPKEE